MVSVHSDGNFACNRDGRRLHIRSRESHTIVRRGKGCSDAHQRLGFRVIGNYMMTPISVAEDVPQHVERGLTTQKVRSPGSEYVTENVRPGCEAMIGFVLNNSHSHVERLAFNSRRVSFREASIGGSRVREGGSVRR